MGYQPHSTFLREAYENHIFISPSITANDGDTEGGAPVSIIEMAASGMPIISTRHCDIPNVVIDNKTGWLTKERDAKGIYNCLKWIIKYPDKWLEKLQK